MKNYAGLDVSLKEVSICVVDEDGKVVARGVAPSDPKGIAGWLTNRSLAPDRIVHCRTWVARDLHRGAQRATSERTMTPNGQIAIPLDTAAIREPYLATTFKLLMEEAQIASARTVSLIYPDPVRTPHA